MQLNNLFNSTICNLLCKFVSYTLHNIRRCSKNIIAAVRNFCTMACALETFQDFLIKLDIKPLIHLLKISVFSLNNDIVRLTKIMNKLVKDCKICTFKVIFQCLKLVETFQKKISVKNIWLGDQLLLMKFFENFDF